MTRALPRVEPAPVATAPRKRPTLRIIAAVASVVLVLAAAGGLARLWVMQQYYVGLDTDQVTIFQGDRSALDNGIVSTNGLEGAQSVVTMLTDRKLKPCPVISATSVAAAPTTAA